MGILSAILSIVSRKLSQIVQAVFGWSITALFGRLPAKKQTALTGALILSLLWPLLIVGVFLPGVASWAVAFVPVHKWLGANTMRVIWLVLAIVAPLAVGVIAHWVAPSRKEKQMSWAGAALHGFPLAIGFAAAFVITLVVVPVLKIAAAAKGWNDEHVYIQVREGQYHAVVDAVAVACERAGIPVVERDVPGPMMAPVKVIKFFARGGLDPVMADDPRMLEGDALQLFVYPADLTLRGKKSRCARVRAALVRELMHAPAHLVEDPCAQKFEDKIERVYGVLDRHPDPAMARAGAENRVKEIARDLDRAEIPFDDWVLLYTHLHKLEREVLDIPSVVDPAPERQPQPHDRREVAMTTQIHSDPRPGASTADLIREALEEARALMRTEIALAKTEMRKEVAGVKTAAIAFGAAIAAAMLGIAALIVAFALAIFPHAAPALVVGLVLLAVAGVAGWIGVRAIPRAPLPETRERLETDVEILKEQMA